MGPVQDWGPVNQLKRVAKPQETGKGSKKPPKKRQAAQENCCVADFDCHKWVARRMTISYYRRLVYIAG